MQNYYDADCNDEMIYNPNYAFSRYNNFQSFNPDFNNKFNDSNNYNYHPLNDFNNTTLSASLSPNNSKSSSLVDRTLVKLI